MSAKKKENRNCWVQCESCSQTFISKTRHECNVAEAAYVEEKIFNGLVKSYDENVHGKLPNSKQNFVVVNNNTLKACKFQVASSVVVSFNGNDTYGIIWPSQSVGLDNICLSNSKIRSLMVESKCFAKVKKVESISVLADEIVVELIDDKVSSLDIDEMKALVSDELNNTLISKGDIVEIPINGKMKNFILRDIHIDLNNGFSMLNLDTQRDDPTPFLCSTSRTLVDIVDKQTIEKTETLDDGLASKFHSIAGMSKPLEQLTDFIKIPFSMPDTFKSHGIVFPKGIILYGPSGTGKTLLARTFLGQLSSVFVSTINGPELTSKYFGETEEKLRQIFKDAIEKAPSVLMIDEFDTMCPKRGDASNESEKRIVATLCTLMDTIPSEKSFVVIGLTNKIEQLDPALRRPGRFEKEIEFTVPNTNERGEILASLLSSLKHSLNENDVNNLAETTHGFVGADLSALCKEAGASFIKAAPKDNTTFNSLEEHMENNVISLQNFKEALCCVRPSALKAMTVDVPKVYWSDVGGQDHVKQKLREAIEWPLKHPQAFNRLGIKPPRGLLLYGPPGCSKTMMAKALATESSLNFISIKGPELFNKYLGESERAVREVFRKARVSAPSIVFFDEIDALGVQRSGKENSAGDKVLAQLLTELDGVESLDGVIVIAATNRPDIIDPALVRPGRIDRMIYVPLPDENTRSEIFRIQFRKMPVHKDVCVPTLVKMTVGYSGAEICSVCHEAGLIALRENINAIVLNEKHFEAAINCVKAGTDEATIKFYNDFASTK